MCQAVASGGRGRFVAVGLIAATFAASIAASATAAPFLVESHPILELYRLKWVVRGTRAVLARGMRQAAVLVRTDRESLSWVYRVPLNDLWIGNGRVTVWAPYWNTCYRYGCCSLQWYWSSTYRGWAFQFCTYKAPVDSIGATTGEPPAKRSAVPRQLAGRRRSAREVRCDAAYAAVPREQQAHSSRRRVPFNSNVCRGGADERPGRGLAAQTGRASADRRSARKPGRLQSGLPLRQDPGEEIPSAGQRRGGYRGTTITSTPLSQQADR